MSVKIVLSSYGFSSISQTLTNVVGVGTVLSAAVCGGIIGNDMPGGGPGSVVPVER